MIKLSIVLDYGMGSMDAGVPQAEGDDELGGGESSVDLQEGSATDDDSSSASSAAGEAEDGAAP